MNKLLIPSILMTLMAAGTLSSRAATLTIREFDGSMTGGGTIAATPNLLNSATLSATGFNAKSGSNIAELINGNLGAIWEPGTAYSTTVWTLTAALDLTSATQGYNITEVAAISVWNSDRVAQNYTLSYSTVSDPTAFITVGNYTANPTATSGWCSLETDITGLTLTHVAALQFAFTAGTTWNSCAYREVEAFGTAAVPEPATWALLAGGLGMLACVQRSRRRMSRE